MTSNQPLEDVLGRDMDRLPLPPLPPEQRRVPNKVPSTRVAGWIVGATAVGAISIGLVLGTALSSYRSHERVPLASSGPVKIVPITRKEVVGRFSQATAEVPVVTRVGAKLMTREEFERLQANGGSVGVDRTVWVWVVAVQGRISPQFGHGSTFSSGTYLVDANSGLVIGLNASDESWPSYFDSLPDYGSP